MSTQQMNSPLYQWGIVVPTLVRTRTPAAHTTSIVF